MGASPKTLARHLEGWELGLLAVAIAGLAVWLELPRPVEPREPPLPDVDRRVIARSVELDRARAERAESTPLPFEVRALGEQVRRHGWAAAHADAAAASGARDEARRLVRVVEPRLSAEPIHALRAAQTDFFLKAVERFRDTGGADRELDELGGNFIEKCRAVGWLDEQGKLALSQDELRALYRMRWAELTGSLEIASLRPTLDEFRLYYRVLMEHPEGLSPFERDERSLAYVNALGRIDGEFATDVARGVFLFRLGRPQAAYAAFSAFAATHESGPWLHAVRNYALAALAQVEVTE